MRSKRCLLISILWAISLFLLSEIVADAAAYGSWAELIEGEFDGREPARAAAQWRGSYLVAIGNLRPGDPSGIAVYLNGVYSDRFICNCEYRPGSVLALVQPGAETNLISISRGNFSAGN